MYYNKSSYITVETVLGGGRMKIKNLRIKNFKSIRNMYIKDIENALILVGKNNTGKTAVLEAVRAVSGTYQISSEDFQEDYSNIEIFMTLEMDEEDLHVLHQNGIVSQFRRYDIWFHDFCRKLPSYNQGELSFEFVANREGRVRYNDGVKKNNSYISKILPRIYHVDVQRDLKQLQSDILLLQEDELLKKMRADCCIFDRAKTCTHCFSCIGLINQKKPVELDAFETAKLLDYKLYHLNLNQFARKVNQNFQRNGGQSEILYSMNRDVERMLSVTAEIIDAQHNFPQPIEHMGKGMRSIYMLSLLETAMEDERALPCIIIVESPEIFLHPQLQKICGEILYRLSRRKQVMFSTHSPNLLPSFNSRQIRQIILDKEGYSQVKEKTDISNILDDLGYSANDVMNVDFVFIVEGKQDKSRLPLLLNKYYAEIYDKDGELSRIAIITTNSCTNIKTYANLKYMNQVYLKNSFLMIRDGDGQDSEMLRRKLCRYYEERNQEDIDGLPRVTEKNVLILKYYSFENYFFNPSIMSKVGVVESEEEFYNIFLERWRDYLHRISSGRKLREVIGHDLMSIEDVKEHMEEIRIYLRGHNLYDIFYGKFKDREKEILEKYIELAPQEDFRDILEAVDRFIYFENRRNKA